jgi:hypothetical protein
LAGLISTHDIQPEYLPHPGLGDSSFLAIPDDD